MQTCSDSMSASTIFRNAGITRSNESGKLIPSRRGHESQVAACGSHSAGIRYPRAAGVCDVIGQRSNVQRSTSNNRLMNSYLPNAYRLGTGRSEFLKAIVLL